MGRTNTALHFYRNAMRDSRELNYLRRAGLLRVAMAQLYRAGLEKQRNGDSRKILIELDQELEESLGRFEQTFQELASRIRQGATPFVPKKGTELLGELGPDSKEIDVIDWAAMKIIGFEDPGDSPCGLFLPVVEYAEHRFVFRAARLSDQGDGISAVLREVSARIKPVQARGQSSPLMRVMFLSEQACNILLKWSQQFPSLVNSDWFPDIKASGDVAIPMDVAEATRIFDTLAKDLVSVAMNTIVDSSKSSARQAASDAARLAYFLGQNAGALYQAAICYQILTSKGIDVRKAKPDESSIALPSDERLGQLLSDFKEFIVHVPPSPIAEWDASTISLCANRAIARATRISAMADLKDRNQEAIWAAAEMRALLRSGLVDVQDRISLKLSRSAMWYLGEDVETLALAQEAAFYCAIQSQLSKSALDVISFLKAPGLTQGAIEEGPIAAKARAR